MEPSPHHPRTPHVVRADFGAQILLVEDIPVTREFLRRLLTDAGYRVTAVGTATEAFAELSMELPDLVVLDLLLPDFNGLEVCRHLRRLPGGEDIPVLIITVDERPSSHAEAVQAGADDFLRKPLLAVELKTRVRSLITFRQLKAQLRQDREAILTLQAQKEELTQFVVHDLKNMLTSILCSAELLSETAPGGWTRNRDRIEGTARAMLGMVQSMLDLSVNDDAGLVPTPESLQLTSWLEGLRLEMESLTLRHHHALKLTVAPDLDLEADPHLLQRVIFNLLENASKYGLPGTEVELDVTGSADTLRITVSDQGPGIPDAMKERVFERFFRLIDPTHSHTGRGLGLAFCHLVLELHQGRIWVEDRAPQGSRFILALPRVFRTPGLEATQTRSETVF